MTQRIEPVQPPRPGGTKIARRGLIAGWLIAVMVCTGCNRLSTEYGQTRGRQGNTSLNGFGALRQVYERAGFASRDIHRLSDRVMRSDVIVWTPTALESIDDDVTRWFERWLKTGDKTLVYVVADSGSEADYWIAAGQLAEPEQRLEYRRRAAVAINDRLMWRLNRTTVPSNGWFRIDPQVQVQQVDDLRGRWRRALVADSDPKQPLVTELTIVSHDAPVTAAPAAANTVINNAPTGPASSGWSLATTPNPSTTKTRLKPWLRGAAGQNLVVEVRAEPWKDSKIIVVAGGSLLTNYAFTQPLSHRLAAGLVDASIDVNDADPRAGFLTSDWSGIPVSEQQADGIPTATGMELLTVWPISLVTIHALMLGVVLCLMLLPIFGRPQRIRRTADHDFGHHLDAVAALMNKRGGEQYARARISEYFKRIHGETSGPWIQPEPGAADPHHKPSLGTLRRNSAADPAKPASPAEPADPVKPGGPADAADANVSPPSSEPSS